MLNVNPRDCAAEIVAAGPVAAATVVVAGGVGEEKQSKAGAGVVTAVGGGIRAVHAAPGLLRL